MFDVVNGLWIPFSVVFCEGEYVDQDFQLNDVFVERWCKNYSLFVEQSSFASSFVESSMRGEVGILHFFFPKFPRRRFFLPWWSNREIIMNGAQIIHSF